MGQKPVVGRDHPRNLCALRRALRGARYDAAIDFQGAVRSAVFGRLAGGRLIGEAEPREWAARWLFTDRIATRGAHVIEQDLELASSVAGDRLKAVPPWLPFDLGAEAWADGLLASSRGQRAVLLNPGAGWGAKRWPVERYAIVAQGLIGRGCRVLVNAGPGEERIADVIVNRTNGVATPLAPSLENLIALTRRASLVIAGDTGPLASGVCTGASRWSASTAPPIRNGMVPSVRDSKCCEAPEAAATMQDGKCPKQAC